MIINNCPAKRQLLDFGGDDWSNLRKLCFDIPWEDYHLSWSDTSVSARCTAEDFVAGTEARIPSSSKTTSSSTPWLKDTCFEVIRVRD